MIFKFILRNSFLLIAFSIASDMSYSSDTEESLISQEKFYYQDDLRDLDYNDLYCKEKKERNKKLRKIKELRITTRAQAEKRKAQELAPEKEAKRAKNEENTYFTYVPNPLYEEIYNSMNSTLFIVAVSNPNFKSRCDEMFELWLSQPTLIKQYWIH